MNFANTNFTVVVPVYNEAESLSHITKELKKFISLSPIFSDVLFVDDGSTDESHAIISEICMTTSNFHYIQLSKNEGLSTALKAGFDQCNSTLVGYIDADGQTSPMDFLRLLEFTDDFDLVTGIRVTRSDSYVKRLSSRIANTVRRWIIDDEIQDTGCPLKILKTTYAKSIPFFKGMHRFIPALVQLQGGRTKQIPIQHFPRFAGSTKFSLGNRLIAPFFDTWAVRWMQKRHIDYSIACEDKAEVVEQNDWQDLPIASVV